jgi:hypothetical protein
MPTGTTVSMAVIRNSERFRPLNMHNSPGFLPQR